jgi:hypothetical protein
LQNEEQILKQILPNAENQNTDKPTSADEELMKANPFVFMMNKAKME